MLKNIYLSVYFCNVLFLTKYKICTDQRSNDVNLSPPAGKMQNYELVHSSKVKFIYPSEEEMGDLTFIVAERKTPASVASSSPCSFNVLLYLLVFQVRTSS